MPDLMQIGAALSVWLLPVLIAITFHEAAHGWAAKKLGDDTAERLGRVTLNPVKHVDPFGTLILPGMLLLFGSPFLFGYAKPVPVMFHRLSNPKRDMIWVALAGPGINVALALICALALHLVLPSETAVEQWIRVNLLNSIQINLVLAIFNMIPINPLDGGRVVTGLLPTPLARKYARTEPYGLLLLLGLLFLVPLAAQQAGYDFNPIADYYLFPILNQAWVTVLTLTGVPMG